MDGFTQKKLKTEGDLEVTGISRSGRVRKKSSKLVDFESPDDLDNRYKRNVSVPSPVRKYPDSLPPDSFHSQQAARKLPPSSLNLNKSDDLIGTNKYEQQMDESGGGNSSTGVDMDYENEYYGEEGNELSSADTAGESASDAEDINEQPGFRRLDIDNTTSASTGSDDAISSGGNQSLYMQEKLKKKLIIKDGKIIGQTPTKTQRKDKGKTRYTAYMLWAKDIRRQLFESTPDIDFSTMSKRLGELWATVPNSDKFLWRKRAKRLNSKPPDTINTTTSSASAGDAANINPKLKNTGKNKFINKKNNQLSPTSTTTAKMTSPTPTLGQQFAGGIVTSTSMIAGAGGIMGGNSQISPTHQSNVIISQNVGISTIGSGGSGSIGDSRKLTNINETSSALFKVSGTQPVDVAAHLKLLGESLMIIGERLKEHEGQIAVSGSLSVLLDSLLCALCPLLCITQQIPEIGDNGSPPEQLAKTLDNIAYIMPGL